jgi:hypothetical protein
MVEISRSIGQLNHVALIVGLEAQVTIDIQDGMSILKAYLNAI